MIEVGNTTDPITTIEQITAGNSQTIVTPSSPTTDGTPTMIESHKVTNKQTKGQLPPPANAIVLWQWIKENCYQPFHAV